MKLSELASYIMTKNSRHFSQQELELAGEEILKQTEYEQLKKVKPP
jgi:hypothetical protein